MKIIHSDDTEHENLVVLMTRGEWLTATGLSKLAVFSPTTPGTEAAVRDIGIAEVRLKRIYETLKELFPELAQ